MRRVRAYIAYQTHDCTHASLAKDAPAGRRVTQRPRASARVVGLPRVGGLHRRSEWREAAWGGADGQWQTACNRCPSAAPRRQGALQSHGAALQALRGKRERGTAADGL